MSDFDSFMKSRGYPGFSTFSRLIASLFLFLFLSAQLLAQTATAPANASDPDAGTATNPYQIATLNNLYWIAATDTDVPTPNRAARWAAHYIQTTDIDASATSGWFSGSGWVPIGTFSVAFTGSYNGGYYSINDLHINRSTTSRVGLFAITRGAEVSNLTINGNVTGGGDWVGLLVGDATEGTTIDNCHSSGTVTGSDRHVGGLIGRIGTSPGTTIINSSSSAAVDGDRLVGGLVGFVCNGSTVRESFATGSVSGRFEVGGLIGTLCFGTTAEDVYATGSVTQKTGFRNGTGGLIGRMFQSKLFRGYSTGELLLADINDPNAFDDMGVLVGSTDEGGLSKNLTISGIPKQVDLQYRK